jgi:hypothetical protein
VTLSHKRCKYNFFLTITNLQFPSKIQSNANTLYSVQFWVWLGDKYPHIHCCCFRHESPSPGGPGPSHSRGLKITHTHTHTHTQWSVTVGRTPLDEWSVRRRVLYLTTHNTHDIHAPSGIRTQNLSRWAAADTRLRPRGHWDRPHIH